MAAHGFFSMVCVAGICPSKSIIQDDFSGGNVSNFLSKRDTKPCVSDAAQGDRAGEWDIVVRSCCSSAGDPRKDLPCCLPHSGPAFSAHRDFVSMLGNSCESFPCPGSGRNKPHAFHLNKIIISDSHISGYLLSLLHNWQEPVTLCSPASTKGYKKYKKRYKRSPQEEHHPAWEVWAWLYSLLNWEQLAITVWICCSLAKMTWHMFMWKSVSLVTGKLRRHPAVCQRWRVSRENVPRAWSWAKTFTVVFGLKNWSHFVNGFIPFPQFFHCYFV